MKKWTLLILFSGIMPFLVSCVPSLQTLVPKKDPKFQDLISLFARREREFQSIKAMISFSVFPAHGTPQKLSGILSFEKGENLRFQGFDPLGRTVVDLTAVNDLYQIILGEDPPVRGDLKQAEGVRLRVGPGEKDLINWDGWLKTLKELRWGGTPVAGNHEVILIAREGDALVCSILEIKGKEGLLRKKIWLERSLFKPVKEEIYEESPAGDRQLVGSITFEGFNGINNGSWPDQIKVKLADGESRMEFLEVNFSPVFPPDYFSVH